MIYMLCNVNTLKRKLIKLNKKLIKKSSRILILICEKNFCLGKIRIKNNFYPVDILYVYNYRMFIRQLIDTAIMINCYKDRKKCIIYKEYVNIEFNPKIIRIYLIRRIFNYRINKSVVIVFEKKFSYDKFVSHIFS